MSGFLPGNISLIDQLDTNIILQDTYERHVAGGLFCDIELGLNIIRYAPDTYERHVAGGLFCDIELGLNIIRGENIVLLGELDEEKERDQPHMKRATMDEVCEAEERLNAEGATSVRTQWEFDARGL
ncbi:hypothetical protein ATCC90586_005690 [Pythium insidiosum]|nr:hypothetical protein ATCC90586_005690 [Pythium insidiosum]